MGTKRQSDIEKITAWFTAADPLEAKVLFQVLKGILASRNINTANPKAAPKKTKAASGGKRTPALSEQARQAGTTTERENGQAANKEV